MFQFGGRGIFKANGGRVLSKISEITLAVLTISKLSCTLKLLTLLALLCLLQIHSLVGSLDSLYIPSPFPSNFSESSRNLKGSCQNVNVNSCLWAWELDFSVLLGQLFLELRPFFFFLPLTFRFKIVFWNIIVAPQLQKSKNLCWKYLVLVPKKVKLLDNFLGFEVSKDRNPLRRLSQTQLAQKLSPAGTVICFSFIIGGGKRGGGRIYSLMPQLFKTVIFAILFD